MVLAAGLGTRLRPLTYEITKPMVPVLDRPVMAHILDLLDRHCVRRGDRQPALLPRLDPRALRRAADLSLRAGAARHRRGRARVRGVLRRGLLPGDLRRRAHRHRPHGARRAPPRGGRDRDAGRQEGARHARVRRRAARPRGADHRLSGEAAPGRGALGPRQLRHLRVHARDLRLLPRAPVRGLGQGRVPDAARQRRALPHPRGARVLERRRLARRAAPGHVRRAARRAAPGGRGRGGRPGRGRLRWAPVARRTPRSRGRCGSGGTSRSARACA